MKLYLDYTAPDYTLSEGASSSGGNVIAPNTVDYFYSPNFNRVLREGTVSIHLELAVSGAMTIKPEVYLGDPVTGTLLLQGSLRTLPTGDIVLTWSGDSNLIESAENGLTLRFITTEESTTQTSAITVGNSYVDVPFKEGSKEELRLWTTDTFRLVLVQEHFFVWTRTDVKERVDLGIWSTNRFKERVDVGFWTTDRILSKESMDIFTKTNIYTPARTNYISDLHMGLGADDMVLQDGISLLRNGSWLSEVYNEDLSLPSPPEYISSPETWRMLRKVGDTFVRTINLLRLESGTPQNNVEIYYPHDGYSGTYLYDEGEWRLPEVYEGTYYIQFPMDVPFPSRQIRHVFFMIIHHEDDSYLTAKMGSTYGEPLLRNHTNSTDVAEVFYWSKSTSPIDISLRIRNLSGEHPGFRGKSAAILYSR